MRKESSAAMKQLRINAWRICLMAACSLVFFSSFAADVREKHVFKGNFDMHTAREIVFTFVCDDHIPVQRRNVYFKSGDGYYVVPFDVRASGTNTVTVNRNRCHREEGTVAGWENVKEIMVSFFLESDKPLNCSVSDLCILDKPYDAVVAVADRCAHSFAKRLEECGLATLLVGASELDDRILSRARLLVPVAGKTGCPSLENEAVGRFKARGGKVLQIGDRLKANTQEKLLSLLSKIFPDRAGDFAGVMSGLRAKKLDDAKAAEGFAAFLKSGGENEIRGIDCHIAYGPELVGNDPKWEDWDRNCRLLKAAGFNALSVNVARGGIAFYESKVLPVSPEVKTKGDSVDLIKKACEKHGMKFVAWKVCFYSRVGMKTPEFENWIAEGRGAVSFSGKRSEVWLCPTRPENRALEIEAAVELAKRRPWAISLDYIRYEGPDWCFCAHCRSKFERFCGEEVEKWPSSVRKDKTINGKWETFRRRMITELVSEIARRVRTEAPGVKMRADVFKRPEGDALSVAQEWGEWCKEGLLDIASPMDGGELADVAHNVSFQMKVAAGSHLMMPTYYPSLLPKHANAKDVEAMISIGRRAGAPGFFLFRFDGRLIEMLALEKDHCTTKGTTR
jgi:hypothetical protein